MDKLFCNRGRLRTLIGRGISVWCIMGRLLILVLVSGRFYDCRQVCSKCEVHVVDFWAVCDQIYVGRSRRNLSWKR